MLSVYELAYSWGTTVFGEVGGITDTATNSSLSHTAVNGPEGTLPGIIYFYKNAISREAFVARERQKPVQI